MKVVAISGSMRFADEMKNIARELETKQKICVLQCSYNETRKKDTLEDLENIFACHYKKIDLADAIYVVNIKGYIGEGTKGEIAYAKSQGKEIIYHEPIN